MKLGPPILWTDRHRLRGPGGPVSTGVRAPGIALPLRAGVRRHAGRPRCARLVTAPAHRAQNVVAARSAAPADYLHAARNERTTAGVPAGPGRDRVARPVFVPGALAPFRAMALRPGIGRQGGPDRITIDAPVAKAFAGVEEGGTRA